MMRCRENEQPSTSPHCSPELKTASPTKASPTKAVAIEKSSSSTKTNGLSKSPRHPDVNPRRDAPLLTCAPTTRTSNGVGDCHDGLRHGTTWGEINVNRNRTKPNHTELSSSSSRAPARVIPAFSSASIVCKDVSGSTNDGMLMHETAVATSEAALEDQVTTPVGKATGQLWYACPVKTCKFMTQYEFSLTYHKSVFHPLVSTEPSSSSSP